MAEGLKLKMKLGQKYVGDGNYNICIYMSAFIRLHLYVCI